MSNLSSKKVLALILSVLFFAILIPILSFAQYYGSQDVAPTGLVPCGNTGQPACDFNYFIYMVNDIIRWIIGIAGVIFTIALIYGGYLYMTSGENPGNKEKAKSVIRNTLVGFIIILTAWLIVYTILKTLAPGNTSILQFIK